VVAGRRPRRDDAGIRDPFLPAVFHRPPVARPGGSSGRAGPDGTAVGRRSGTERRHDLRPDAGRPVQGAAGADHPRHGCELFDPHGRRLRRRAAHGDSGPHARTVCTRAPRLRWIAAAGRDTDHGALPLHVLDDPRRQVHQRQELRVGRRGVPQVVASPVARQLRSVQHHWERARSAATTVQNAVEDGRRHHDPKASSCHTQPRPRMQRSSTIG